jgi:hypothetical protein
MFLLIALLLGACGGDDGDDDSDNAGDSTDNTGQNGDPNRDQPANGDPDSLLFGLPDPSRAALRLPIIENAHGSLLFMQGNALYLAHFDGQPAILLDTFVNHFTLRLAPNRRTLSYVVAVAGEDNAESELILKLIDLHTLEQRNLITVTGSTSRVLAWSPAGEHMLIAGPGNGGLSIIDVDGSFLETLVPAQDSGRPMVRDPEGTWLTDGRVLYLAPLNGDSSTLQPMLYDLATGENTAVNVPLGDNPRDLMAIEQSLRDQNMIFPPTFRHFDRSVSLPDDEDRVTIQLPSAIWNFQTQACDQWTITQREQGGAVQRELYTVETTYLSDLRLLPDNTLLFLEWHLPNCSINTNLQISLQHLDLDGEVETLTDDISPQFDGNLGLLLYHHTQRYDLTPDGRYLVWLSGDIQAATTGIAITDLQTGQSAAFIETIARSEGSSFLNIFWIPDPPEAVIEDDSADSESEDQAE